MLNINLPFDTTVTLLGIYSKVKNHTHTGMCTVFITAFLYPKTGKKSRYQIKNEWMNG